MNILITGGTGFIGSRLALRSIREGHSVTVLGKANTDAEAENLEKLRKSGAKLVVGTITEPGLAREAVQGCNIVFHLAAAQHEANVPDSYFHDINVTGTANMLQAAEAENVKCFVHGSTIGVYGSAMEGELDETTQPRPVNIYGKTKLDAEDLVLSHSDRLPVVIIRISETYGPGDRRLLKLFRAIKKNMFFTIGNGLNKHQLIYVEDLIDGLYLAAENSRARGEIITLAGSEILTTDEMIGRISKALSVPQPRLHVPLWPFMLAAVIFEKTLKPIGIQPPLHRRRLDFFRKSFYFSRRKAKELLSFEPKTEFEQGAIETAKWYMREGLL